MKVVLFEIPIFGGIPIRSFGVVAMIAYLAALGLIIYRSRSSSSAGENESYPIPFLTDLTIICLVAGIVGSRIFFVVQEGYSFELFFPSRFLEGNFGLVGCVTGALLSGLFCYFFWFSGRTSGDEEATEDGFRIGYGRIVFICFLVLLGVFLGGRIQYVMNHPDQFSTRPGAHPFDFLKIWQGGIVYYGGFLCAFLAGGYYILKNGYSFFSVSDLFAPAVLLAHAIGRWACFFAGDDFGIRTSEAFPLALRFPQHTIPGASEMDICSSKFSPQNMDLYIEWITRQADVYRHHMDRGFINTCTDVIKEGASLSEYTMPVHPSQFYMSGGIFLCFLLLLLLERMKPWKGWLTGWMVILYSIHRFIVEFWRGDPVPVYDWEPIVAVMKGLSLPQVHAGEVVTHGLRISQLISVGLLPAGILILFLGYWLSGGGTGTSN